MCTKNTLNTVTVIKEMINRPLVLFTFSSSSNSLHPLPLFSLFSFSFFFSISFSFFVSSHLRLLLLPCFLSIFLRQNFRFSILPLFRSPGLMFAKAACNKVVIFPLLISIIIHRKCNDNFLVGRPSY